MPLRTKLLFDMDTFFNKNLKQMFKIVFADNQNAKQRLSELSLIETNEFHKRKCLI